MQKAPNQIGAILSAIVIVCAGLAPYIGSYYRADETAVRAMAASYAAHHAGFGSYGPQDGDGTPTVAGKEQIAQTAEWIADNIFTAVQ